MVMFDVARRCVSHIEFPGQDDFAGIAITATIGLAGPD